MLGAKTQGILDKLRVKVGDGKLASFWRSRWLGTTVLADMFPSLFLELCFKDASVQGIGYWCGEVWCWTVIRAEEILILEATIELQDLKVLL